MTELREDVVEQYRHAVETQDAGEIAVAAWELRPSDAERAEATRRAVHQAGQAALDSLEHDDDGGSL